MATYNGEQFLEAQLASIFAQDYPNLEVWALDDGSTDETVGILKRYEASHGLRFEVNDQNLGPAKNFQKVMGLCRGQFIALADQDDVWLSHKITRLVEEIEAHDALMVHTDAILIDEEDREIGTLWDWSSIGLVGAGIRTSMYLTNCATGCTTLCRRLLVEEAFPMSEGFPFHDWWLAYVAACHDRLHAVPEALTKYRQHPGNLVGARKKRDQKRVPYFKAKLGKYRRLTRSAHEKIVRFRIFVEFEERSGIASTTSRGLLALALDSLRKLSLQHHASFLDKNPDLFRFFRHPEDQRRRLLRSTRRKQLILALEALLILVVPAVLAALLVLFISNE